MCPDCDCDGGYHERAQKDCSNPLRVAKGGISLPSPATKLGTVATYDGAPPAMFDLMARFQAEIKCLTPAEAVL